MRRMACVLAAVLTGCQTAPVVWNKAGGTKEGFDSDRAQCRYEVALATTGGGGPTRAGLSGALGQGVAEGITLASDQRALFDLCMQARGYHKAPAQ